MADEPNKVDDDPLAAVRKHEERIELLERQVAALMRLYDSRLRGETGSQNVSHVWPK